MMNLSNISQEELQQYVSKLLAQRSRFYAQVIVADLQNLPSLKASLLENLDSQPVLNKNNVVKQNNLVSSNSNNNRYDNGNVHSTGNAHSNDNEHLNHNRVQPINPPVSISAPIQQQNQVTSKPKTLNVEEILIDLVVQQTGYPQESITPDLKLLDDLNLDSIKAGELIAEAAKKYGIAGEIDPSALANATLKDIAEVMKSAISNNLASQPTETIAKVNSIPTITTPKPKAENDILSQLDQLSEADIDSLLSAHLNNSLNKK